MADELELTKSGKMSSLIVDDETKAKDAIRYLKASAGVILTAPVPNSLST